jgi:hypothetical protein
MIHARDDYNRIQDPAGKIPADEPVFLLRAQDKLACIAVAYYAELCQQHQAPEVAKKAMAHSDLMAAWPKKKTPDLPASDTTGVAAAPIRTEIHPDRRTTEQLLAAAAQDTDVVSVFYDGANAGDTEAAIFVVKGMQNVEYLAALCERQGLLTDKPVTGPACNLNLPWLAP